MDIIALVQRLVQTHKTTSPYVLCKNMGIYVLRGPLYEMRGFFQVENDVQIIHIANDLSPWADAFVCAHELGHCFMHAGLNRVFLDSRTFMVPSRYEDAADKFACQLLYAQTPLMHYDTLYDWQLADCLNVPVRHVEARLLELGAPFETLQVSC